eukprot:15353107-Ditylum_brightwellii.AAC.1
MRILMLDYILKLLDALPEEYDGEVVTPAVNHLLQRASPDLQTSIAFLSTQATKEMPLTLEANNLGQLIWWVDTAFVNYHNMQSHTGGVLLAGTGAIHVTSIKQKLNTQSSTNVELAGVNNVLPQVLWTRYFLEGQGIKAKDNIVYQDKQSVFRLIKTGRDQAA